MTKRRISACLAWRDLLIGGFSDTTNDQQAVKLPDDWNSTKVARGIAAAQHIARIVATLPGDNAGMVVYVDNEAGTTKPLLPYYKALFRELQADHADGRPALRAGIYIQAAFIQDILRDIPDLYIWRLDIWEGDLAEANGHPPTRPTPIEQIPNNKKSKYQRFQINRYPIIRGDCFHLPVGRQCTLVGGSPGNTRSVIVSTGEEITASVSEFDFDVSFVRDPGYPQADPRFVYIDGHLIYSTFQKSGTRVGEAGSQASPPQSIEAKAPLFRVDQELYFISRDGTIDVSTRRTGQASSTWDKSTTVVPAGDLRRICTFNVLRTTPKETVVFYISRQYRIQSYTRTLASTSSTPTSWPKSWTIEPGNIHPFSDLAAALFKSNVYLFFTQSIPNESIEATLCTLPYPSSLLQPICRALKGTSIAAVALTNYILLFFLGKDCLLHLTTASIDPKTSELKWTPPIAAAKTKIHPHTHLSTCTITPSQVKISAISAAGIPIISTIDFIYGSATWSLSSSTQYKRNSNKEVTSPNAGFTTAKGWSVNPYGDIALVQNNGSTELYCAGTAAGVRGILLRRLEKDEPWLKVAGMEAGESP